MLAGGLWVCGMGYLLFINWKFHSLSRMGCKIRGMLMSALFEKALRLHVCAADTSAGSWTNLVSNDTERLFEAGMFLHYLWLSVFFVMTVRHAHASAVEQTHTGCR